MIDEGIYCYKVMPFDQKNMGATYQWLVNKVFKDQIDHNMEVYVDNMIIKNVKKANHIADLE